MLDPQVKLLSPRRGGELDLRSLAERIWLGRQMARLDKDIGKYGWGFVPFQMPHDRAPRWFYTAGFEENLGQPEIIVFDAPAEVAFGEFQTAFETLRRGGAPFEDGMVWAQEEGVRTVFRKAHPDSLASVGWLALAQERYRKKTGGLERFRAFQLVLPDREGRLPWEPGHDEQSRTRQPQLYDPPQRDEPEATPVGAL